MPELWEPYGDVDEAGWWTTRDGRRIALTAMTTEHLERVLGLVRQRTAAPDALGGALEAELTRRGITLPVCRGRGPVRTPHNTNAGYVAGRKNSATGCHTILYVALAAGIDADTPYVVCCEAHGGLLEVADRDEGYRWLRTATAVWCSGCQ